MDRDASTILQQLKHVYLFQEFTERELRQLTFILRRHYYRPGELVFSQGTPSQALYIVHYGLIKLETTVDQLHRPLYLGSGRVFGEAYFHLNEEHVGTAEVMEVSELYKFCFSDLDRYFYHNTEADLKFHKQLATHLGHNCHRLLEDAIEERENLRLIDNMASFV